MKQQIIRNRKLLSDEDVFTQNAWDDFELTDEMISEAERKIEQQRNEKKCDDIDINELEASVSKNWEQFYQIHTDKFFKDRRWIFSELPEILTRLEETSNPCSIFEVGCGVGNAVVQILGSNKNQMLHLYCADVSSKAIQTLKQRDLFLKDADRITAFQADIHKDFDSIVSKKIEKCSLDFITMIFFLSALKPHAMEDVVRNLATLLKPGGMIFFRDYGKFDLTQIRFKGSSYLSENYYKRSDGTTSYFFELEQVHKLLSCANLEKVYLKTDNRLLVNRSKMLKMCRCWIQAKYKKPDKGS